MKLVIASDIHGSAYWCRKMLEVAEKEQPDHLILLGDILYHGPRNDLPRDYAPKQVIPMLAPWAEKILCVRGNCEAEVDQMVLNFPCLAEYSLLMADSKSFYLTHGHHANPQNLPALSARIRSAPPCVQYFALIPLPEATAIICSLIWI